MEKKQFIVDSTISGRKKKVYKYRFKVRYKDAMGNSRRYSSKWYDTKEECHEAELLFRTKKEHPSSAPFKQVALACLDDRKKRNVVSSRTIRDEKHFIDAWFVPWYDTPITDITPQAIDELLSGYLDQYSTSYVRKARGFLNAIFKYAMKNYGLPSNPIDMVEQYHFTEEEQMHEMTVWTAEQFETFFAAVPDDKFIYKVFFLIMFWTGMRKNEALSLTWKDYDGKRLRIYRQWQDGHWTTLKTKKSIRTIQLDERCINALDSLKKSVIDDEYFSFDWFIFGGPKPIGRTTIDRIKNDAIKEANLPYIRMHDFRHSHASYLISKGVNMFTVSRRLGHASIQMTIDRYTHLMPDAQDEVIKAITG